LNLQLLFTFEWQFTIEKRLVPYTFLFSLLVFFGQLKVEFVAPFPLRLSRFDATSISVGLYSQVRGKVIYTCNNQREGKGGAVQVKACAS
jgi:hypothetical protein